MSQSVQDDLAFVRAMAEEGRSVPLVGGPMFMLWGGLVSLTAFISWLDNGTDLPLAINDLYLWTGMIVVGWLASFWIGHTIGQQPGASTFTNKTIGTAWFSVGAFITIFWISIVAAGMLMDNGGRSAFHLGAAMFPVSFGLYGMAFNVMSTASGEGWMARVAWASWALASVLIFLLNSPLQLLVAAIGTFGVVFVPGLIFYRQQPSATV